eukprot:scaffold343_cov266-Chaetoceros_neogracile.AAC.16
MYQCIAFTPGVHSIIPHLLPNSKAQRCASFHMANGSNDELSRRGALRKAANVFIVSSGVALSISSPADAKEKIPVTREAISQAFQAVRYQLESPEGGVKTLEDLIAKGDFDEIMEFTKNYDLEFRKAKMVKARKLALTSKDTKDRAISICNAVTFDLIGMNKGSRVGQQDINEVKKYFEEMKVDVARFLEMEKDVDFAAFDL